MSLFQSSNMPPVEDRGPLRVLFALTSMPVGGAEILTTNLIRNMDRDQFVPEVCCLKDPGPLGLQLSREVPVHTNFLAHKLDLFVLPRLMALIHKRQFDAVVTVGAGDKMFWGRLAAWRLRVPVICSALHSTGWPDQVGWLNRRLNSLTDAFIAVAVDHGRYLVDVERFPQDKVHVIPNGIDVRRFQRDIRCGAELRDELGIPRDAPVCGLIAALRPEKNHSLFLRVAARVRQHIPTAHFVLAGDGPIRGQLEQEAALLELHPFVHFLGNHDDVPRILSAMDLFLMTSNNEAKPISILEAMACELPVVATNVGSIFESVEHESTGFLASVGNRDELAQRVIDLLANPERAAEMGSRGRSSVEQNWSLERTIQGYQDLIQSVYQRKISNLNDSARSVQQGLVGKY